MKFYRIQIFAFVFPHRVYHFIFILFFGGSFKSITQTLSPFLISLFMIFNSFPTRFFKIIHLARIIHIGVGKYTTIYTFDLHNN
eukprot:UN27279